MMQILSFYKLTTIQKKHIKFIELKIHLKLLLEQLTQ